VDGKDVIPDGRESIYYEEGPHYFTSLPQRFLRYINSFLPANTFIGIRKKLSHLVFI
jgi:hypothetical protein